MGTKSSFRKKLGWALLVLFLGVVTGIGVIGYIQSRPHAVHNFAECEMYGYPLSGEENTICTANHKPYIKPETKASTDGGKTLTGLNYELLVTGDSHGTYPAKQVIITNQVQWEDYWKIIHASIHPTPPLIPINFAKRSVVAVNEGPKDTDGYKLSISSIQSDGSKIIVMVDEVVLANDCHPSKTPTNIYNILSFDKATLPIIFNSNSRIRSCS